MRIEHRYDPWTDKPWAVNENVKAKRSRNRYHEDPEYRELLKAKARARHHAAKGDDAVREAKRQYDRERYKARIERSGLTVRQNDER